MPWASRPVDLSLSIQLTHFRATVPPVTARQAPRDQNRVRPCIPWRENTR